jgi:hypothetical protein
MTEPENVFRHNVTDPPERRYHQPGIGGRYAARTVSVSTSGDETWVAWQGYEPETGSDEVWCQAWTASGRAAAILATPRPGDHMRPVITAMGKEKAHVYWIADQRTLMRAEIAGGNASEPRVLHRGDGWLRELTVRRTGPLCRGIAVESIGDGDRLLLFQYSETSPSSGPDWTSCAMDGYISRPDLVALPSGELLACCDVYERNQYHIALLRLTGGELVPMARIDDGPASCLQGRLSLDSEGTPWICYLRDTIVERDGVVNRAASVCVDRYDAGCWTSSASGNDRDIVPLHRGLLPDRRYFGYAGLRRNPYLVATRDGAMHLLWEQQRSEEENWDHVWNGVLLSMRWTAGKWDGPFLWRDGGSCFSVDYHTVHAPHAVACLSKEKHREQGDDYARFNVDTLTTSRASADTVKPLSGWMPYTHGKRPNRRPETSNNRYPYKLYFGDFHNHSVFSPDAEGHPDELHHFARDVAGIDFAGITDNDFYPEKALLAGESAYQRMLVKRLDTPGHFLPFAGFEWTFHRDDGQDTFNHRSVVYLEDETRIIRRIEPAGGTEENFRDAVSRMNVLAHAHHAEYTLLGISQESNVEISSGWAINMELSKQAHDQLRAGHKFGFSAASDSHRAVPGLGGALVGVWAKDLTREAIAEAMKARRCFATTGNRPVIEFSIGETFMGGVMQACNDNPVRIQVRVQSDVALKSVSLIRNGTVVHEFECAGNILDTSWCDHTRGQDAAWYYLRVEENRPYQDHPHNICQAVGHLAWSSPIWVENEQHVKAIHS